MALLSGLPVGFPQAGDTTEVNTSAVLPVGTIGYDKDGNQYIYVTAGAAIAQYDACRLVGATLADVRPTSAVSQAVLGVAQVAIASGSSGWLLKNGDGQCKTTGSVAFGSILVSSATAGTLKVVPGTFEAYFPAGIVSVDEASPQNVRMLM